MQHLIVYCTVLACGMYALWVLMPATLRRVLAGQLQRLPLGVAWQTRMQRAAKPTAGCDCSGCDKVVDLRSQSNSRRVIPLHIRPKD